MVTVKSSIEVYTNLIYYFWWLMLAAFVFLIGGHYPAWSLSGLWWLLLSDLILIAMVFIWFMLVRPSVLPKHYTYFVEHTKKTAIGFIGIYALLNAVRAMLLSYPTRMIIRSLLTGAFLNPLYVFLRFRLNLIPFVIFPPFVCIVLFYFDSDGGLKAWLLSFARGLIMYIYNLPFCLISMFLFFLIWSGLAILSFEIAEYMLWLFVPVMLSYFKVMYVKRLYDQFNLYYANE